MRLPTIAFSIAFISMAAAMPAPEGQLQARSTCGKGHSEYYCIKIVQGGKTHDSCPKDKTCAGEICILASAHKDPKNSSWDKIYKGHVCCNGKTSGAGSDGKSSATSYDSVKSCVNP